MKKINGCFFNQDIISVEQFSKKDLEIVFALALEFKKGTDKGLIYRDLQGKILAALFYESSSRTFGSFISAMQRLGGGIIPLSGMNSTSVSKGETLNDTIMTFQSFSDVIVIRHSEKGTAAKAAKTASIPIINAGDGVGEHPTQALLDLFTIQDRLRRLDNLKIAMTGDLKYGRTVHSLAKLLSQFKDIEIYLISPEVSPMPEEIVSLITKRGVKVIKLKSLEEIINKVDVLYMTRVQKERMDPGIYTKIKDLFKLNNQMAKKMKKDALIMHPLPRVGEIEEDVDNNPRACYLKYQMRNGMFVRMALLRLILKR